MRVAVWVGQGDTAPVTERESFGKEGQTPGGVKMRQKFEESEELRLGI